MQLKPQLKKGTVSESSPLPLLRSLINLTRDTTPERLTMMTDQFEPGDCGAWMGLLKREGLSPSCRRCGPCISQTSSLCWSRPRPNARSRRSKQKMGCSPQPPGGEWPMKELLLCVYDRVRVSDPTVTEDQTKTRSIE